VNVSGIKVVIGVETPGTLVYVTLVTCGSGRSTVGVKASYKLEYGARRSTAAAGGAGLSFANTSIFIGLLEKISASATATGPGIVTYKQASVTQACHH